MEKITDLLLNNSCQLPSIKNKKIATKTYIFNLSTIQFIQNVIHDSVCTILSNIALHDCLDSHLFTIFSTKLLEVREGYRSQSLIFLIKWFAMRFDNGQTKLIRKDFRSQENVFINFELLFNKHFKLFLCCIICQRLQTLAEHVDNQM